MGLKVTQVENADIWPLGIQISFFPFLYCCQGDSLKVASLSQNGFECLTSCLGLVAQKKSSRGRRPRWKQQMSAAQTNCCSSHVCRLLRQGTNVLLFHLEVRHLSFSPWIIKEASFQLLASATAATLLLLQLNGGGGGSVQKLSERRVEGAGRHPVAFNPLKC